MIFEVGQNHNLCTEAREDAMMQWSESWRDLTATPNKNRADVILLAEGGNGKLTTRIRQDVCLGSKSVESTN